DFFHARWNQGGGIVHAYEAKVNGGALVVYDQATGLMWQRGGSAPQARTYDAAKTHIKTLNASNFGGFHDWRLPTLEEAMSLMTSRQPGQSPETGTLQKTVYHIDRSFEITGAYFIWTADFEPASRAWVVYFADGTCAPESLSFNAYVRAVRSNR